MRSLESGLCRGVATVSGIFYHAVIPTGRGKDEGDAGRGRPPAGEEGEGWAGSGPV